MTAMRRRRSAAVRDEAGPLAVREVDGRERHTAPPGVVSALRYAVARLLSEDKTGVPTRLGVTAALSGEGVSFVARSLAAVLAHDGEQSICLVDLNWWSDHGDHDRPGAAEVLRGEAGLDDVLVATDDPRLVLLPAGLVPVDERAGLARSAAVQGLLEELSFRFQHLVIDLPALLVASEALTLASYTEACALVVRHGVTPVQAVQSALDHLGTVRVLGVVFNRTTSSLPRFVTRRLPTPAVAAGGS